MGRRDATKRAVRGWAGRLPDGGRFKKRFARRAVAVGALAAIALSGTVSSASVIDSPPPGSARFLAASNPAANTYWSFPYSVTTAANGVRTITSSVACNLKDPTTGQDVHLRLIVFVPGNFSGTPAAPASPVADSDPRPNPPAGGRRPAVVYFHGGGWYSGDETDIDLSNLGADRIGGAIKAQLSRGWVVISAEYRLSDKYPFPAALIDAKAAVNCAKRMEAVNRNHVVVAGSSAGGHLATMVALTGSQSAWEPAVATNPSAPGATYNYDGSTVDLVAGPDQTTVKAAVNLDGPNDLRRMHAPLNPYDSALVADNANLPYVFGTTGGRTFANFVPKFLCPTASSTAQQCRDNVTASSSGTPWPVDKASPIFYVPAPPIPPAAFATSPPRLYLACGDSSAAAFSEGFRRCNDHWAMYDRMAAAYGPNLGTKVQIDTTSDNYPSVGASGGNHNSIDVRLDLVALQAFLDGS